MEENFVSIKNFKHLYKLLNEYSEKKYKKKLDLKQYKKLIGNTINEISIKYKNKIKKKEKNIMTIMIIKKIIDKENKKEESFFESDFEPNQKITKKDIEKNYNLNNIQYQNLELERERNYNKILRNDNNNLNIKAIKKDEEKFRKNLIENKKKFEEIEKKKNLKNINESIVINPKEYKETLKKYIRKYDLLIDSKDRDITLFEENEYQIELDEPIHNVFSIELLNAIIPNSDYIINNTNNLLHFKIDGGDEKIVTVTIGNYTITELLSVLKDSMEDLSGETFTITNSTITNKITIAAAGTTFDLLFEDKENSISKILGFQSKNYINLSNYTSDNEIILDSDRNIFLSIENIDNIQTTNKKLTNVFLKLTLNSDKNKYTYIKTDKDNIYKMRKPLHIKKLLIQFKKYDNSLYNFNGLDHSLILRIHHFNTKYII